MNKPQEFDSYELEEPSDEERAESSSEDELEVYFDSDSEGEDMQSSSTGRRRKQRSILTNDELLYDPEEDDRDQAWVDARRTQYTGRKRASAASRSQARRGPGATSSDAVLNCPACMTTLCLDCQR
ncbi:hypothetical protein JOQ06_028612 [Pogonophryne albipinna]|uniref:E2F-associated phosphoprotein n=1 Tax=Pogonophryne albipinna TaxID=1090488 RepID=A0AAD6FLW2_9TELE|nr:hypothetical protein JOQ06_028612 [Pogonophryne albipinna]